MAVKIFTVRCDHCGEYEDDFEDDDDATSHGWWFVIGPPLLTDEKDLAYCSLECLESDLL